MLLQVSEGTSKGIIFHDGHLGNRNVYEVARDDDLISSILITQPKLLVCSST